MDPSKKSSSPGGSSSSNKGVNFSRNEGADWLRTGSGKTFEEIWGVGPNGTPLTNSSFAPGRLWGSVVVAPNGTTTRVNVIYDRGRTYMDVNALRQFVREYSGGSSGSSSGGSNISRDYTELADFYGKNSYSTSDRLLNAKPVELIARAIYGEMTKASEQLAVAWTMVNRVIAQQKSMYAGGLATSLLNVVKHPKAYAALEGEGGNRQSFNSYTSSNSGWLNAITLAQKMLDVLDKHYPRDVAYAHSDRVIIRNEVSSSIGHSPIGGATYYRTTTQFDELVRKEDGKDKYLGNEIYGIYKSGSHTYFSYIKEADYDYGL